MSSPLAPDRLSVDLEATLARCATTVRTVAAKYGLRGADVDEVFQEVRIRLWKALDDGEKISSVPASYVYRTAATSALDIIRRRRARKEDELDATLDAGAIVPHASSNPAVDLDRRELVSTVRRAVEELIESRRPVVRMYLAGYKLDEIADLLGWSQAKTRNLLYRGLDDLRKALVLLGVQPGEIR